MACDTKTLANLRPRLQALSDSELKALRMILWANAAGYTLPDDLNTLLAASATQAGMSDTEQLRAEVALMGVVYQNTATTDELRAMVKCVLCLPPGKVKGIEMLAKCEYWQAQ